MSQENVEATKRANAALNRGDFDGAVEVFAADAVLQDTARDERQRSKANLLGSYGRKEAPGVRVRDFLAFMPTPSVASTARRQALVEPLL
ncbi:MAG TPA: hypothetical protein VKM72_29575 [Thermoanaerobaculia bacterium]|nr:hypothetical protein [Thermoanaerobaculia bacterium]